MGPGLSVLFCGPFLGIVQSSVLHWWGLRPLCLASLCWQQFLPASRLGSFGSEASHLDAVLMYLGLEYVVCGCVVLGGKLYMFVTNVAGGCRVMFSVCVWVCLCVSVYVCVCVDFSAV